MSDGARVGTNGSKRSSECLSTCGRLSDTRTTPHSSVRFRAHLDTPTRAGECVLGVDQQVQNGLLQLGPVAMHQTRGPSAAKAQW